jgi:hypothetical protein
MVEQGEVDGDLKERPRSGLRVEAGTPGNRVCGAYRAVA